MLDLVISMLRICATQGMLTTIKYKRRPETHRALIPQSFIFCSCRVSWGGSWSVALLGGSLPSSKLRILTRFTVCFHHQGVNGDCPNMTQDVLWLCLKQRISPQLTPSCPWLIIITLSSIYLSFYHLSIYLSIISIISIYHLSI